MPPTRFCAAWLCANWRFDALRHRQADEALSLSKQLLQETNSTFRDRLLRLDVLQQARPAEFKPALTAFQHEAATDPAKITELATWQMANKTPPQDVLTWLRTLPPNTQTNLSVEILVAECYIVMQGLARTPVVHRKAELGRAGVCSPRISEPGPARAESDGFRKSGMGTGVERCKWSEGALDHALANWRRNGTGRVKARTSSGPSSIGIRASNGRYKHCRRHCMRGAEPAP